ncbi:MAG: hypothetical protein ACPIOQ_52365, partial [Promethearchaeia archaeon]
AELAPPLLTGCGSPEVEHNPRVLWPHQPARPEEQGLPAWQMAPVMHGLNADTIHGFDEIAPFDQATPIR